MNIAIDVDGVVADLASVWLGKINAEFGTSASYSDLTNYEIASAVGIPEHKDGVYNILRKPGLYDQVLPIPGALLGVLALRSMGHRVFFVTFPSKGTFGRKFHWLVQCGFLAPDDYQSYVECHDKSLIQADILLDDFIDNLRGFSGYGVMFNQPWNSNIEFTKRVSTWEEFVEGVRTGAFIHPTEAARPLQAQAFRQIIEQMYQVHLDKNYDYSPANVLGAGDMGLVTRSWDKLARIMNLSGFNVEIEEYQFKPEFILLEKIWNTYIKFMRKFGHIIKIKSISFLGNKSPKNESFEDALIDMAVYLIIWRILRQGFWGK